MVGTDERAVSESMGIVILVGFTVLVTATVGISVLFVQAGDTDGPTATFTFEHDAGSGSMLVEHGEGDSFPAGTLVVESGPNSVTWAQVANAPANQSIGPGAAIQLSSSSAWGESVSAGQPVELYYAPGDGNRTLLDSWEG